MGRAKKKPEYDQKQNNGAFQNCIVEAYTSGIADGTGISLRQVSEEFCITLMKTRKNIDYCRYISYWKTVSRLTQCEKQGMKYSGNNESNWFE